MGSQHACDRHARRLQVRQQHHHIVSTTVIDSLPGALHVLVLCVIVVKACTADCHIPLLSTSFFAKM